MLLTEIYPEIVKYIRYLYPEIKDDVIISEYELLPAYSLYHRNAMRICNIAISDVEYGSVQLTYAPQRGRLYLSIYHEDFERLRQMEQEALET